MKTRIQSLSYLASLAAVLGLISWGSVLSAQTTPSTPAQQTPQTQPAPSPEMPPAAQQAPSSQSPSAQPSAQPPASQAPDASTPQSGSKDAGAPGAAASSGAAGAQTFSGTVEKQGDKYVLKDDSGKTYEIDHQDDVKKFEGKRVRVQGTLDASGKILVK